MCFERALIAILWIGKPLKLEHQGVFEDKISYKKSCSVVTSGYLTGKNIRQNWWNTLI
jgi:hypothetical protein